MSDPLQAALAEWLRGWMMRWETWDDTELTAEMGAKEILAVLETHKCGAVCCPAGWIPR